MVSRKEWRVFFAVLFAAMLAFGTLEHLGRLPSSVHAWRQADALSMALNFHADGCRVDTPRLHFMHGTDGKAVGEFPLTYYICAVIWTATGTVWPGLLPALHLVLWAAGLAALYAWARERTGAIPGAAVAVGSVALTPLAAYYAGNYLINVPALGAVFVGWWAGWRALERPGKWGWAVSAAVAFALAMLWRPTMGIGLVPVLVKAVSKKRWDAVVALAGSVGVAAVWIAFATSYNRASGSVYFLTTVRPFWEAADAAAVWEQLRNVRIPEWGTRATRWAVGSAAAVAWAAALWKRRWANALLGAGVVAGLFVYFMLWYSNLDVHDYYLIEGLLVPPLAAVGLATALSAVNPRWTRGVWWAFAAVLAVQTASTTARTRAKRGETATLLAAVFVPQWQRDEYAWLAWDEARRLDPLVLHRDALHRLLGPDALVISFPDPSPNITLTRLDIQGFTDLYENELRCGERVAHFVAQGATHLVVNDTAALAGCDWGPWLDRPVGGMDGIRVYDLRGGR
jgi:hypothetical protein